MKYIKILKKIMEIIDIWFSGKKEKPAGNDPPYSADYKEIDKKFKKDKKEFEELNDEEKDKKIAEDLDKP